MENLLCYSEIKVLVNYLYTMQNKMVHMITFILLVVGGLNWLLVGVADMNLVAMIFGGMPMIEKAVYVLVGLSAIYEVVIHKSTCTMCGAGGHGYSNNM